jgi:hypothetical protein
VAEQALATSQAAEADASAASPWAQGVPVAEAEGVERRPLREPVPAEAAAVAGTHRRGKRRLERAAAEAAPRTGARVPVVAVAGDRRPSLATKGRLLPSVAASQCRRNRAVARTASSRR